MGKPRPRPKNLPAKLIQIRKALGLSQAEIIERLDYSYELTQGMLSNFETAKREAPFPLVLAYARLAGISTDYLIDDSLELPEKI